MGIASEGRRLTDLLEPTTTNKVTMQYLLLWFVDLSVDISLDAEYALQQLTTSICQPEGRSQRYKELAGFDSLSGITFRFS